MGFVLRWSRSRNGRACYVHPLNAGLVIKIRRQDRRNRAKPFGHRPSAWLRLWAN